jgi:hypothetical protein
MLLPVLASLVVVASGLLLIGFAVTAHARPELAEHFLMAFARSARAHYLEQTFRLVIGASIVVLSPNMWQATGFSVLGWSLVMSSIALMLLPWKLHHRLGKHVLPKLVKNLKLFAVSVSRSVPFSYTCAAGGSASTSSQTARRCASM